MNKNNSSVVVFTKWITRNGKRIYASQYGLQAFKLVIPQNKYKAR